MQLGVAHPRLSQAEKDRHRRDGLCLYCGNRGHFAAKCPVKDIHSSDANDIMPSQWAMVDAVTVALDGEVADWVADLYSDNAQEFGDVNLLLEALKCHFDVTQT
ncbi:hypothetical protein E2320_002652 [Naja naja]|nr:hypothetical protein E2320_002652 [Naja naja]